MLVVPISSEPAKPWLDQRKDAAVIGIGRIPGSIVVIGQRASLFDKAVAHGAILLPALPMLCGELPEAKDS
jgi:hypothetical protein